MHKLPQPVKLWYCGAVLPPRAPRRPAATASSTRSAPRRSAPTSPLVDAEAIILLDELLERAGRARDRADPDEPRLAGERAASTARSCAPTCASTRPSSPPTCASGIDANPLRAFDANDEGTRAVMDEGADAARPPRGRGRRALRRGARAARRRRGRLRARPDPGARARLLHAHGLRLHCRGPRRPVRGRRRRPLRRPGRAARRPADPRGAAGRPGSSGSCWPSARSPRSPRADVFVASPTRRSGRGRWPSSPSCAAPAWRPSSTSPGAA